MLDKISKNWKSTAAGLALLVVGAAFLMGKITIEQFLAAFTTISAAGFVVSGDAQ